MFSKSYDKGRTWDEPLFLVGVKVGQGKPISVATANHPHGAQHLGSSGSFVSSELDRLANAAPGFEGAVVFGTDAMGQSASDMVIGRMA